VDCRQPFAWHLIPKLLHHRVRPFGISLHAAVQQLDPVEQRFKIITADVGHLQVTPLVSTG
jgi:hypothetical protein